MFDTVDSREHDTWVQAMTAEWDRRESALQEDAAVSDALERGPESLPHWLDAMKPGIHLAALLASIDPKRLSGHDRIRMLRAHQRMSSYFHARLYHDMASVPDYLINEDDSTPDFADEAAAAEIRAALRLTRRAADSELTFALDLRRRLPSVWDALAAGVIDVRRAKTLVYGTGHVPIATARSVVDEILPAAAGLTTGQITARLRTLCIQADPDDAEHRYRDALSERRMVMEPTTSGTANLLGLDLPPHRVAAATRHINHLAQSLRRTDEPRTIDQLRADVLLDLLTGVAEQTGRRGGVVDIHVDLATLAELTEAPGDLAGYGPVIADIARQVAERQARGEWRFTVTQPESGSPVGVGITRRRPTAAQRRFVESMARACVFPGCRMPATECDLDHRHARADGGPTTIDNLIPLCRHDHRIRHQHGWTHQPSADGDHTWTSSLGHTYTASGRSP